MTRPKIYWIDFLSNGRLAVMPRRRAGDWLEDEIKAWKAEAIDSVVSLLEPEEIGDLGLADEAGLCRALEIEFIAFPIPDRGTPASKPEALRLSRALAARLDEGKAIAIHCRAGIGRAALIAACALILLGFDPDAGFELIGQTRGVKVPDTREQRHWAVRFRDFAAETLNGGAPAAFSA